MRRGRWIRLDTTWSSSEWIAALKPSSRLAWVELLCYVKAHGTAGWCKRSVTAFCRVTGVTRNAFALMEKAAIHDHALTIEDGDWVVNGWPKYQMDKGAPERMKRYRERGQQDRQSHGTVGGDVKTPVTRNARNVTRTGTGTGTGTNTHSHTPREAHTELAEWMGQHAEKLEGLTLLVQASLWGLYGPRGTDHKAWRDCDDRERPRLLATALLRWKPEEHDRLNSKHFRTIIATVIAEDSQDDRRPRTKGRSGATRASRKGPSRERTRPEGQGDFKVG